MGRAHDASNLSLNERLETGGFRFTSQREHVYSVLLHKRDHPTAQEVFIRAKRNMPGISMATIYNCLEALVRCGLARELTFDKGPARFCPNMSQHGHFYCDRCDRIFDIDPPDPASFKVPKGFAAASYELVIHGSCPACGRSAR